MERWGDIIDLILLATVRGMQDVWGEVVLSSDGGAGCCRHSNKHDNYLM